MTNKNIFVIIVTYKGHLWYDRCFTSLRDSELPVQTVVIDNASNDGTVEYIHENYPEIHLIASETNLGFGQGNNKGMRYALDNGADYVFLLNQDAWIEPNTLKELVDIHQKNSEYGILSVMNITKEKDNLLGGFINYIADYDNCDRELFNDLYWGRLKDVYEIKMVLAAAWLIPRKTLETIGGFDPIFFHYGEDDNYAERMNFHSIKIGICPKLHIVHDAISARTDNAVELRKKKVSDQRSLLLSYCNINIDFNLLKIISSKIKIIIQNIFKLKIKDSQYEFKLLLYTIKRIKQIKLSRHKNVIKQANWL